MLWQKGAWMNHDMNKYDLEQANTEVRLVRTCGFAWHHLELYLI